MSNTFFVSDTHFGHHNIMKYEPMWAEHFDNIEERDEHLIKVWNERVKLNDTVYHLGDVAIPRRGLKHVDRLNGRKILIKGNHDIFKMKDYYPRFVDIRSYKMMPKHGIICSHIPVHHSQLEWKFKWNVHGHTHGSLVTKIFEGGTTHPLIYDERYINVCVEHLPDFGPISFDELKESINKREET